MRNRSLDFFSTVKTEGAMLPPEILVRIAEMDSEMGGLTPDAYHLDKGEKINEAINRSWNRLLGVWTTFRKAQELLPQEDLGTTLTRDKWLLKLFDELGYGRLLPSKPMEVEEKIYPVSHFWQHTPIHLIGFRVDLDKSLAHHSGAYRYKPHSMVQTLLNRTEGHLWAFLSNGLRLRILRDNTSLVRQAYVEFDLEAMMDGGIFPDFKLLWLLCHQSRVEAARPEDCWLESWTRVTQVVGTRARENLRNGVQRAIEALGAGFLAHPANEHLRGDLRAGRLDKQNYYRELLRFVYQLIFLFVAEDRELLAPPSTTAEAKDRYIRYYSMARLRRLAERKMGTRHDDLYRVTRLVIDSLGEGEGRKELGIPILNSSLFSPAATPSLKKSLIANVDYLEAIRALAITSDRHGRRPTDYRNLGSEELGSVYESLLELHPEVNIEAKTFSLKAAAGSERKTTGSYYTPTSLISCLLDSALDPVLDEAVGKENPEKAILDLKVCDPACGSGHFLIAAAQRMASRLASVRTGGEEPPPDMYRRALRDVIGRCIYGVDINPMAVELCKVSLWMEALEPGKPLSFLDHHIRAGNSLLGATPELIAAGLPDDAFTPIEGDGKKACAVLKKRNKAECKGLGPLFARQEAEIQDRLQQAAAALAELPDVRPEDIRAKEMAFRRHEQTEEYRHKKQLADAWCAAFVIKKYLSEPGREASAIGITQGHLNDLAAGRPLPVGLATEADRLSSQYQIFHWHLAFPEVFTNGGFDCVLGNPPWERIQPEALLFFSSSHPELLYIKRSERNRAIEELAETDPAIYQAWVARRRTDLDVTKFLKSSGIFPLSTVKNVNSYAVFQELALGLVSGRGRSGLVLQSGIATDDINKDLFRRMMSTGQLASLFDFENRRGIFVDVHRMMKFCLLTCRGKTTSTDMAPQFVFNALRVDELRMQDRVFELSADELVMLSPNTGLCPTFRSRADADLVLHLYRSGGAFIREANESGNPWLVSIRRVFSMAYDSETFTLSSSVPPDLDMARVYEAKMFHQFDHRYASYDVLTNGMPDCRELGQARANPKLKAQPRFFASRAELMRRIPIDDWSRGYLLGYRDVTNAANERTCIACVLPREATDDTIRILFPRHGDGRDHASLVANLNSFVLDYSARNCVASTHLSEYLAKQLPVLPPNVYSNAYPWGGSMPLRGWIFTRVLELVYTSWDLEPFAQDCGWSGPSFRWNEERRFLLRCELDAAFFHLYLQAEASGEWHQAEGETVEDLARLKAGFPTPRDAVAYIMDTFPIVKRKDEAKYGTYRTKDTILEIYDEMARVSAENAIALATGLQPTARYQTRLNPPPGPPCDAQGNVIPMDHWDCTNWPSHIHQPREAAVTPSDEVPMAVFAAIAYPSTDGDKAISAAALAVVEQSGGLSSVEHLDALLLATHPDWCRAFLDQKDLPVFNAAVRSAPGALFVGQNQSIRWKDCRDYLERLNALTVAHGNQGQSIAVGTALPSAKATLPQGVDTVVAYVFKALDHIRKLRQDLSTVPQAQRSILDAFTEQHRLYELAA